MHKPSINPLGSPKQTKLTVNSSKKTTKLKVMMWCGEGSISLLSPHNNHGTIMSTQIKTGEPTKTRDKINLAACTCKPK